MARSRSLLTALIVGSAVIAGVAAAAAVATLRDSSEGGRLPSLDVRQDAVAEDAGIRVEALAAAFSGTGTFVELVITIADEGYVAENVAVVRIPPADLGGTLRPAGDGSGLAAAPSRPVIARFEPLPPGVDPIITISGFELQHGDGSRTRVTGQWELPISTPPDLLSRLRLENLAGGSATDTGIRIAIEGAVRSTTETLVTIRVDSDVRVDHLGQPIMTAGGKRLLGGMVAEHENGRVLTFAFPPTEFGQGAEMQFGPFVSKDATLSGSVQVDLGAVIARANLTGADDDKATILPTDVVSRSGAAPEPTNLGFLNTWFSSRHGGRVPNIVFSIPEIRSERDGFEVLSATGKPLETGYMGYGYEKDPTGAIHSPHTDLGVLYGSLANLDGVVTITYSGATEEIVRGEWRISLTPVE